MTQVQLTRLLCWLSLGGALIVLCFGWGYRLEMDTRSGKMRRMVTLLGLQVWRGLAEESIFSEALQSSDQAEPNWVWVGEREVFSGWVTDCFCIYDLSTFLHGWEMMEMRRRLSEMEQAAWRYAVRASVKELEKGADVCDVLLQTRAFLDEDRLGAGQTVWIEEELSDRWREAGSRKQRQR
jgi:hypothetical protein